MNISYKWLKEYVDFELTPQETANALTSIGLEVSGVEEVETIKGGLKGLVVGEVLTCEAHPDSDHMHVCTVNIGETEPCQIVCGAPNIAAGQKVIVATLGTKLYDDDKEFCIKKSKLRGIESYGMICAEDEIGVGTSHTGIIVLPHDTKVGIPASKFYQLESDYVIEVDITPNRSDACSHYGVARDLYAWLKQNGYKTSLHRPSIEAFKVDNHDLEIKVEIEDKMRCPRYSAVTVTGCEVKESPKWLQNYLQVIGIRPINNIVDITNYIMMAYGQPLHCFDADMVKGNKVIVKTMPEGSTFVTLDGIEHKLCNEDLAICNKEEAMCIAGVFGGKGSGTYETTTNVLFESAYFNPTSIRKTARRQGLSTDASFRFERGIDPNGTIYALKQAAIMAKELAGGKISMEIEDVYPEPVKSFPVTLNYNYANTLIGKTLSKETYKNIAESLEMKIVGETTEELKLEVPTYRTDVQRPCDVVEDILRIYGYNNVDISKTIQSALTVKGFEDCSNKLQNMIAEQLTGQGFHEIMNNSLTKSSYYATSEMFKEINCSHIMNPLSEDLNVMRQTLLFGGLESIKFNINHKAPNQMFYEFGKCYNFNANKHTDNYPLGAYHEDLYLGLWMTGKKIEGSWAHDDQETTIFMLKGYVENIVKRLGLNLQMLESTKVSNELYSTGIVWSDKDGKIIFQYGIVNPTTAAKADLHIPVCYADFNWVQLMKKTMKNKVKYKELSNFPVVSRDLALLLDKNIDFSQIEKIAFNTERKFLKRVELFDVYEGRSLPEGKKSYAVNFILHDENRTMSNEQIEKIMHHLIQELMAKLNAELR